MFMGNCFSLLSTRDRTGICLNLLFDGVRAINIDFLYIARGGMAGKSGSKGVTVHPSREREEKEEGVEF